MRPKTRRSPTSRSRPAAGRSRPARPRAATASRSTTSSCASKRTSARPRRTPAAARSRGRARHERRVRLGMTTRTTTKPSTTIRRRSSRTDAESTRRTTSRTRRSTRADAIDGADEAEAVIAEPPWPPRAWERPTRIAVGIARADRDHVPVRVPDPLVPRAAASGGRGRATRSQVLKAQNEQLARQAKRCRRRSEIERLAREQFNMVLPGRAGLQRALARRAGDHHHDHAVAIAGDS